MSRIRFPLGFPCGSAGKESACNAGDLSSIPGLGRSPGEGKGYPLQCSCPGEFHRLNSPWGRKELDTTERLWHTNILGKVKKNSSHTDLKLKSEKGMLAGKQEIRR